MLAYFGVFVVAPLTALVVGLVAAGLVIGTVVALLGGAQQPAVWRLASAAVVASFWAVREAWLRLRSRWARPVVVSLATRTAVAQIGPKASGIIRLRDAGLHVLPGFVVTQHGRAATPVRARAVERALARLGAAEVIVRSSFEGEDGDLSSGAGRFRSERGVRADGATVLAAVDRVFNSAPGRTGGVLIQPMLLAERFGVVSTVDPRTGFRECAVVQRALVDALGDEHDVQVVTVDRVRGQQDPAVVALDRVETDHPLEAEVAWTTDGPVFLQVRALIGVPTSHTFLNGGPVAFPPVPLTPASRSRYLGAAGLANRLRLVHTSLGLPGPEDADIREHLGRFYAQRTGPVAPEHPWRWTRSLLAAAGVPASASYEEALRGGARAGLLAEAWWRAAEVFGPIEARTRQRLEAGVQPSGRPGTPEELSDPAYMTPFPAWTFPPVPPIVVQGPWLARTLQSFCLRRYRAWLVARFAWREHVLVANRAAREALGSVYGSPEDMAEWRRLSDIPCPAVLHDPPGALAEIPGLEPSTWGPAVPGAVEGPLVFLDAAAAPPGSILWVPDARSHHAAAFDRIAGLMVDHAGPLSHLVLLAREAALPTVVGPRPHWPEGTRVRLDGATGRVTVLP